MVNASPHPRTVDHAALPRPSPPRAGAGRRRPRDRPDRRRRELGCNALFLHRIAAGVRAFFITSRGGNATTSIVGVGDFHAICCLFKH